MSIKLWETFFSFLSQNPDWHQHVSFKNFCLTAQSSLLRQLIPPMVSIFLTQYHEIIQEEKKKIWNKPNPSSSIYNHIHSFNHFRQKTVYREHKTEKLVTPQSINYWSVQSHVFSTGKSHWKTTKISDIQKISEIWHSFMLLWEVNCSRVYIQNESHSWEK